MPESASPDAPGPDTSPAFTALHVRVMMRLWGWLPWLVVAFLIYLSIVLGAAVRRRVAAKEAGAVKPVLAPAAGEVTAVLVKPGEHVTAGQEIAKVKLPGEPAAGKAKAAPPFPVAVIAMRPQRFVDRIVLPGVVEANNDVSVRSQVRGTLIERPVHEGQTVRRGQLLAQIEPCDYVDALETATAALTLAQSQHGRVQRLIQTGAATQAELDAVEASLRQAKARKSEAETALRRAKITAPIDGRIEKLYVEPGELIEDAALVARIIDAAIVKINIAIPEADVSFVRELKEVEFRIDSLGQEVMRGSVAFVTLAPAERTRVYGMVLRVHNADGKLRPGMIVKADVVRQVAEDGLVAPLFAVLPQDRSYAVFVEDGGVAHKRGVKLGPLRGQQVLIREGLAPGDRLIVQGQRQIDQGQRVEVVRTVERLEELLE